jgi:hypothetical protein
VLVRGLAPANRTAPARGCRSDRRPERARRVVTGAGRSLERAGLSCQEVGYAGRPSWGEKCVILEDTCCRPGNRHAPRREGFSPHRRFMRDSADPGQKGDPLLGQPRYDRFARSTCIVGSHGFGPGMARMQWISALGPMPAQ